jgi:hypothetical protein
LTATVAAALAAAGAAAGVPLDSVSTATASGPGGVATVSAGASHPRFVTLSIVATPSQRISLTWRIRCSNGFAAGSKSGQTSATAPLTRTFRFGTGGPATCSAQASAQLNRDGQLTVKIVRG